MDYLTVAEAVTNLRSSPGEGAPSYGHDDSLLTQLLFNERVLVREESAGWVRVEAVEQQTFRRNLWEGYAGWVRKESLQEPPSWETGEAGTPAVVKASTAPVFRDPSEGSALVLTLSIGTRLTLGEASGGKGGFCAVDLGEKGRGWIERQRLFVRGAPAPDGGPDREDVLRTVRLFLGVPYLWGGRSMHMPQRAGIATGVDCSGLVNLVFRVHGIDVPRDVHEQHMRASPVPPEELKPCDLVFVAPREGGAVAHVMVFAGGESFIEAYETGGAVTTGMFRERFGATLVSLAAGADPGGREVSFGKVLP